MALLKDKLLKIIKNTMLFCLSIIVFGVLSLAVINGIMISYAEGYTLSEQDAAKLENADCILVLGCGVWGNDPSPLLADRLQRGVALFQAGCAPKILMSGDHGQKDYDEVNVMKQYARDFGISESDIFLDHAGFSTYESMYRAKEIFGIDKMIIVTQAYHLPRAVYAARSMGIDAYGVASDYKSFGGQFYRDCREVLARVKDAFICIFQPLPTYLGEAIPISGDGTLTNG